MAQEHPTAAAIASYRRSRLPFARPQTLQTLPCSSQAPLRPQQTFPAAPTSPWGPGSVLLRTFKAAACQPAKLAKPSPAAPRRHSGPRQTFPEAPTSPWGPGSVFLWTFKAAVCQPAKLPKPSPAAPNSGRGRPFPQLQQVSWGPGSVLLRMFKAAVCQPAKLAKTLPCSSQAPLRPRHSQAPLRPRQTFPAAPTSPWGPGSVPFKDVQGCRLPAHKTRQNAPLQLPGATPAAADLSCSSNKSLRPWQCPFKDVQGCRLPGRKTRQTLPCTSQAPLTLQLPTQAAADPFLQLQQVPEALAVSF